MLKNIFWCFFVCCWTIELHFPKINQLLIFREKEKKLTLTSWHETQFFSRKNTLLCLGFLGYETNDYEVNNLGKWWLVLPEYKSSLSLKLTHITGMKDEKYCICIIPMYLDLHYFHSKIKFALIQIPLIRDSKTT